MRKSLLLLFICISTPLLAQKTDPFGANLTSQSEVNEYGANNYEITSSLIISGSDITDLSPLSSITTVEGELSIFSCSNLLSLNGLDSVTSVGGLRIIVNDVLDNVDALSNLTNATTYINIVLNPMLTSVAGLDNLETIAEGHPTRGDLDISNNPLFINYNFFE